MSKMDNKRSHQPLVQVDVTSLLLSKSRLDIFKSSAMEIWNYNTNNNNNTNNKYIFLLLLGYLYLYTGGAAENWTKLSSF